MTLAVRARLAWLPLLMWLGACAYWTHDKMTTHPPDGPLDWTVSALIYGTLFVCGCISLTRDALAWARRAKAEGPQTIVPITWHRRSGSWTVIALLGGVVAFFGLFALIAYLTSA